MLAFAQKISKRMDWVLFSAAALLVAAGLVTMNSFVDENYFFERQIVWASLAFFVFLVLTTFDFRFLRRTSIVVTVYGVAVLLLGAVALFGDVALGAQSWFDLGLFSVQPVDIAKLALILVLAKYFSRRHVEIAHVRHILVSGAYALVLFLLVFIQPDFGSAIIIFGIWGGMVLVSGISKKHLAAVVLLGAVAFAGLWFYVFEEYQKQRIISFLHPLTDLQGVGYNAYQSTIAVGSGELFGKGIGFGTQSKLQFLPEYETDFIFAAFAEEWGFIGVLILFALFGTVIWRIIKNAMYGATNFEILFGLGVAVMFMSHFIVHVGMNVGLLPVTGTVMPLMSYGGSHLITEFIALGILMGQRAYARAIHKDDTENEFVIQ